MMMRLMIFLAVLGVLPLAGGAAVANDHMDFQRLQCNSTTEPPAAQISGCRRVAGSTRIKGLVKAKAFYNLGVAYGKEGKMQAAADSFTQALNFNPDDENAAFNRELALLAVEKKDKEAGGGFRGKTAITRLDLPEDMRRNKSASKTTRKKKAQKTQTNRTIQKRKKAKRTRAERKKVE